MELRRYASLLRRWLWLIILFSGMAAGSAFIVSSLTTPVYEATTTLLINQAPSTGASPDYNSLLTSERLAKTYRELLTKRPVLQKVIASLNITMTESQLAKNIKVQTVRDTQLLTLSVDDTDARRAILIANQIGKEFSLQNQDLQTSRYSATKKSLEDELAKIQSDISRTETSLAAIKSPTTPEQVSEQSGLQAQLAQFRNSYSTLLKSFEDVRLAEAQSVSNLTTVEEAQSAPRIKPNTISSIILATFIGLLLAFGIVFLVEYLDDSVKNTEQIEQIVGASTLGVISRIRDTDRPNRLVTLVKASSPVAEAYRVLRANIEFSEVDHNIQTLLITSSNSGEGKSTTAANLAVAMAQTGKSVILVDTDLRRPSLHKFFQQANIRGVTSFLLEHDSTASDHFMSSGIPNLSLLATGPIPPNPAELIGSQRMADLVTQLKTMADIVVFDSSPLLPVADPTLLARLCDASLIVISSGTTRTGTLKKAVLQLSQSGTRVLGGVLNRVSTYHSSYYYYQSNYSSNPPRASIFGFLKLNRRKDYYAPTGQASQNDSVFLKDDFKLQNDELRSDQDQAAQVNPNSEPLSSLIGDEFISNVVQPTPLSELSKGVAVVKPVRSETELVASFNNSLHTLTNFGSLKVILGPASGVTYNLTPGHCIIGRTMLFKSLHSSNNSVADAGSNRSEDEPPAMFPINDETISRQHAELVVSGDGVYIRDLGSRNGTWIDGKKIGSSPIRLKDGVRIQVGPDSVLVYEV